jgi:hypothetical protein
LKALPQVMLTAVQQQQQQQQQQQDRRLQQQHLLKCSKPLTCWPQPWAYLWILWRL